MTLSEYKAYLEKERLNLLMDDDIPTFKSNPIAEQHFCIAIEMMAVAIHHLSLAEILMREKEI